MSWMIKMRLLSSSSLSTRLITEQCVEHTRSHQVKLVSAKHAQDGHSQSRVDVSPRHARVSINSSILLANAKSVGVLTLSQTMMVLHVVRLIALKVNT